MIPAHAPFSPDQQASLSALLGSSSPAQRTWLSGFLAGLDAAGAPGAAAPTAAVKPQNLTVFYGTESGNSEELAARTVKAAKKKGVKATMQNLAEVKPAELAKSENFAMIVSTWGDGEPPEAIEAFHKDFMAADLQLKDVNYAICALGDTSYEKFCEMGKIYDDRLQSFGATRLTEREDCDVDYDASYSAWADRLFAALGDSAVAAPEPAFAAVGVAPTFEYGKKNPFSAEVLDLVMLNGEGSNKETLHLELSLEGSGLTYEVGDALALIPENAHDVVEAVLSATGFDPETKVSHKAFDGEVSLREALTKHLDITGLSRAIAKKYLALVDDQELENLLSDDRKADFNQWVFGRQILDLVQRFPLSPEKASAQDFVSMLRKLPPRLYSIASSIKAHPDEVHLTIAAVRYETDDIARKGVASTYVADDLKKGDTCLVYTHTNKNFRLPEDDATDIIMVGPGTGVAPFRAFVEERDERDASGKSWLFFGDQKYSFDFLYQLEWQDHLKSGALSKLDVAFSRDQPEKYYVQDLMRENAAELYLWLENGASFYVCGDAQYMAKDVHQALLDIVAEQGGKSEEEAATYLADLKKAKRYQRDVY